MFTGLIETVGTVATIRHQGKSAELSVEAGLTWTDLTKGESIAVNGVCLTLTGWSLNMIQFHALAETLHRSNLGEALHKKVNLERALKLGDRLGGHIVSGHVDCTTKVNAIAKNQDDIEIRCQIPKQHEAEIVQKGSVAINGISLTVADLTHDDFAVRIIPHTWNETNLSTLRQGDIVNIETDIIGKYVLRRMQLPGQNSAITMETLLNAGF